MGIAGIRWLSLQEEMDQTSRAGSPKDRVNTLPFYNNICLNAGNHRFKITTETMHKMIHWEISAEFCNTQGENSKIQPAIVMNNLSKRP